MSNNEIYKQVNRLKFGLKNEIIFLKDINDLLLNIDDKIKLVKYEDRYAPIDFFTYLENSNKYVNLELKCRRFLNNKINLFINYSKLQYIKAFELKHTFLVWKNMNSLEYYYLYITPMNLEELLNKPTIVCWNQRTTIVSLDMVKKTNNLVDLVNDIVNIYTN